MAGNIIIIEPHYNFQKVAKDVILNKEIDVLTLGVYVRVLCLGKKWKLNVRGLASTLGISADRIRAAFSALEKTGYLKRTRAHDKNGKFCGWDYAIGYEPITDIAKTPTSVNSDDGEKPMSEKRGGINRDVISQKEDFESKEKIEEFSPPSLSEVKEYARSRGWTDPEGFADFYLSHHQQSGWRMKDGRPITSWKRNVLSWEQFNKDRVFAKPQNDNGPTQHQMSEEEFREFLIH